VRRYAPAVAGARAGAGRTLRFAAALWAWLRALSGDDAYERFRAHLAAHHPHEPPPTRREFYEERERYKWSGVTRCC